MILGFAGNTSPGERRACIDRRAARIEYVNAEGEVITTFQFVGKPCADSPHLVHGNAESAGALIHGFLNPQQACRTAHFCIDRPAGADGGGEKVVIDVLGRIDSAGLQGNICYPELGKLHPRQIPGEFPVVLQAMVDAKACRPQTGPR